LLFQFSWLVFTCFGEVDNFNITNISFGTLRRHSSKRGALHLETQVFISKKEARRTLQLVPMHFTAPFAHLCNILMFRLNCTNSGHV
jgi:hypothetical protein